MTKRPDSPVPASPRRALSKKDLLDIDGITEDDVRLVLDTAESMREINQRAIKKVKTRTTDGETTHEIELFDPLAAARLDAELDGTLSRGGASTMVQVNVNTQESFEQKVQRLIGAEKTEAPATLPPGPAITLIDPLSDFRTLRM